MTTFYTEVPAHVQHSDHVSNQVQVRGGTNWDLSRSAVETPITPLADPEIKRLPATLQPVAQRTTQASVHFSMNSVVVPENSQKILRALPRGTKVVVDGYAADTEKKPEQLSQRRANEVAARLRKLGAKVERVQGHGTESNTHEMSAAEQRRVDVRAP